MKYLFIFCIALASTLTIPLPAKAQAQELEELALDIEKLSMLKKILSEMYTGYKILTTGYNAIKDISEGNFSIHKLFLDKLLSVSPLVKKYTRITDIIRDQRLLVSEYKTAWTRLQGSQLFSAAELSYCEHVFDNLIGRSLEDLDQLLMVITDGTLRASDAERIKSIDGINAQVADKLQFLRAFNDHLANQTTQRQHALQENQSIQRLFGIQSK